MICLASALVFHELTDMLPATVWLAIGRKDRKPRSDHPPMRFVRFPPDRFSVGVGIQPVAGGQLRVTDPAHTIVDLFRYRDKAGLTSAIEGLKRGLVRGRVTPAAVAETARDAKAWRVVRPYLEAIAHG